MMGIEFMVAQRITGEGYERLDQCGTRGHRSYLVRASSVDEAINAEDLPAIGSDWDTGKKNGLVLDSIAVDHEFGSAWKGPQGRMVHNYIIRAVYIDDALAEIVKRARAWRDARARLQAFDLDDIKWSNVEENSRLVGAVSSAEFALVRAIEKHENRTDGDRRLEASATGGEGAGHGGGA